MTCVELPPCPKEFDNSIGIVPQNGQVLIPGKSCKRIKQPSIQLETTKSPNLMSTTEAKMLTTAQPEILPPCPDSNGYYVDILHLIFGFLCQNFQNLFEKTS